MGKLLIVACTNVGRYMIEEIYNNQAIQTELVGVINLNAAKGINKANYDNYEDLVIKYEFPIFYCNSINDEETKKFIKAANPDLIIQSGWSQKFSEEILDFPKFGCIGEHPSPLPKGRGAACVNWAILTGETIWGDSFFEMVNEYDAGKLYAQNEISIMNYDNVKTVYDKIAYSSQQVFSKYIDEWSSGKFTEIHQNLENVTYYKSRKPADGLIDFNKNSKELYNFIRALTNPYPNAFFRFNHRIIKVVEANYINQLTNQNSGRVINFSDFGINIACSNGTILEIAYVQEEGLPPMWAKDWAILKGITIGQAICENE